MPDFPPLTPQERWRVANGGARAFLRLMEGTTPCPDAAIEAALAAAPNDKGVMRAARRLARHGAIFGMNVSRTGNTREALFVSRSAGTACVSRIRDGAPDPIDYRSPAIQFRLHRILWPKRYLASSAVLAEVVIQQHAIARFLERGPLPPHLATGSVFRDVITAIAQRILAALAQILEAESQRRLDPDLSHVLPVPCPIADGLWFVERIERDEGPLCSFARTYVGGDMLSSEQHGFLTLCEDGDLAAALRWCPDVIRRRRPPAGEARAS